MHPGAWLAWSTGAAAAAVATTNPFYLLPLTASAWVVHAVHHRRDTAARSFRTFALFAGFAFVSRIALVLITPGGATASSLMYAAQEGLRLATILVIFGTFNSVAEPARILRLAPRRWHEPALVAALALTIAPRMIDTAARVREAQKMRGIETSRLRRLPALAVPVLAGGMEEALVLAESMDARGHGRGPRSRYRPQAWTWKATLVAGSGSGAGAVFTFMLLTQDPSLSSGVGSAAASALGAMAAILPCLAALVPEQQRS